MIMGERAIPRFCLSTADSPPFLPPHLFHQAALVDLGGHAGHASHITMSHGPRWCLVSRKVDSKKQFQIPTGYTVHICTSHLWVVEFIGTHLKKNSSKMGSSAPFCFGVTPLRISLWILQSLVVWNPFFGPSYDSYGAKKNIRSIYMVHLPIQIPYKSTIHVGKCTNPMNPMG